MRAHGLTFVELLLAIAVIGLAFAALLSSQVTSLKASARARLASDAKAFAVGVLERKSAEVLKAEVGPTNPELVDDPATGRSFYFIDYYYGCPTPISGIRPLRDVACQGQETGPNGLVADWAVFGEPGASSGPLGIQAEGVVTVVVTARAPQGVQVTVGRRVTCYDVYPSPTHDKPRPCPNPGGGRP